jgi:hypothetical protein
MMMMMIREVTRKISLKFITVRKFHNFPYQNKIHIWATYFSKVYLIVWSHGSSVSIASDYGLDDWAIRVRSPVGAKDFSSNLCVQTGSGAHPASCSMGTGGPFSGAKCGRGVTLTTNPILCRSQEWVGAIPPLPSSTTMACSGTVFAI